MKIFRLILLISCLLPIQAKSAPFGDFDARSAGMGSVGVANSSLSTSAFYNPAMLNHQEEASDFELSVAAGLSGSDKQRLRDDIDAFRAAFDAGDLVEANIIFQRSLNKPMAVSAHGGAAFGINASSFNLAVIGQRYAHASLRTTGTNASDAQLEAIALDITEVGLATSFGIGKLSVGLTPKSQSVTTYDYKKDLQNVDSDFGDVVDDLGETDHGSNFNLDLGLAYQFTDSTFAGLTVRNVSKQSYTTLNGTVIELEPQARLGLAYRGDFFRIGLDVDVTENKAIAFESKTQYAAIGVEFNAWDWVQLRVGYRDNLAVSEESRYTAGVGLHLFGAVGVDVAVQADDTSDPDEVGGYVTVVAGF